MKNLLTALLLLPVAAFGQVQINKPLELTGSGLDARVMGIDTAVLGTDAVPLKMLTQLPPVYIGSIDFSMVNAAPSASSIALSIPATLAPSGYILCGVFMKTTVPFSGATIMPDTNSTFIYTNLTGESVASRVLQNSDIMQSVKTIFIPINAYSGYAYNRVGEMSSGSYAGGLTFNLMFNGINLQNYGAGNTEIYLSLLKSP